MNFYEEILRIADSLDNEKDKAILYTAAVKFAPLPKPSYEESKYIPGFGTVYMKVTS